METMRLSLILLALLLLLPACKHDDQPGTKAEATRIEQTMVFGQELPEIASDALPSAYLPSALPAVTVQVYIDALKHRMTSAELPLYTAETKAMLAAEPMTDEGMDTELRQLKRHMPAAVVYIDGKRAVIRFSVNEKAFPPYFLVAGEHGWELDLAGRRQLTERDAQGNWRFTRLDHPYMFAYKNARFIDDTSLR